MALKPWYTVVVPREDLREGKPLDASEFAVHLDHVRTGSAPVDYTDAARFFGRTYLTKNLIDLAAQTIRRLSGIKTETSPVFNLSTQFGGGKTHALTLLYHLATNGEKAKNWDGVNKILEMAEVNEIPTAKTGIFVGTEFSSVSGRCAPGEPTRKTPWGEIAFQIGGADAYEKIRKHDEIFIAPAGDDLNAIFDKDQPYLLLFDEILNYISKHRNYKDLASQFYDFLLTLTEFVRSRNNILLAVSIPASELEMTAEDQADFDRFKKMLDRLGKAVFMSADKETSEIIRRRLFDWQGMPTDAAKTISEHVHWLRNHETHIPSWFPLDKAREAFEASYPFHPNVLSLFERKWQSLPRFQQTRGMLRLLALWVSRCYSDGYKNNNKDALLTLGTAPLEDPIFRAAVFEQMGENRLEGAVTTDIAGKSDSHAIRFGQESTGMIKKLSLHKKSATTIFFESNGGQTADKLCTLPEIKLNLCDTELDIGLIDTVLQDLVDGCYYLTVLGSKYKFSTQENLIKRFSDKKATIKDDEINTTLEKTISESFSNKSGIDTVLFPTMSNQVSDRANLSFFILHPDSNYKDVQTNTLIKEVFDRHGNNPRVYKNGIIGVVPESSQTLKSEARKLLAWTAIGKDASELNFDKDITQTIKENINRARLELKEQVWRTYRHLYLFSKDGEIVEKDMGLMHSSQSESLLDTYLHRLMKDGEVSDEANPNLLVRNWPPALTCWPTISIRDSFFSSPSFPRILKTESLKNAIAKGVANGIFAYCQFKDNKVSDVLIGKTISNTDIELSNEVCILQADEAKKYQEPRKLSKIQLIPSKTTVKKGEKIRCKVSGYDQFGDTFEVPVTTLVAEGATILENGLIDCNEAGKIFINSSQDGVTATTVVEVFDPEDNVPVQPPNAGKQKVSWNGEVPLGKWMVFYNKILSKHTGKNSFKVKVNFEFEISGEEHQDTIENIKSELSELGLEADGNIEK